MRMTFRSFLVGSLMIAWAVSNVFVSSLLAQDSKTPPGTEIDRWVNDLGHDQYLRRENANRKLVAIGTPAVQPLAAAMNTGDLEVIERAIDVITEIGFTKAPSDDGGAWDQLSRIATVGTGQKASRAQSALSEIRAHRATQALAALKSAGVTITTDKVFALSSPPQPRFVVTIGETWNGELESLQWLRWLDGIDNAQVKDKAGSRAVIEQVVKIPNLKSISFVDAIVDESSLEPLKELKRIESLEFRYSDLKDEYGDLIASLPIRSSLELTRTGISKEVVESMQQTLSGLEIMYRQGGFLGVQCTSRDSVGTPTPCQITSVVPRSAAQKAGLLPGDIIVHVGTSEVRQFADLQQEINRHIPGDDIEVKLRRGGQVKTLQLQLGRFPEQ
jgi:hypothetical protein